MSPLPPGTALIFIDPIRNRFPLASAGTSTADAMTAAPVEYGAAFSFTSSRAKAAQSPGPTPSSSMWMLPGALGSGAREPIRFNAALQTYRGHHIDGAEDVVAASYVAVGQQRLSEFQISRDTVMSRSITQVIDTAKQVTVTSLCIFFSVAVVLVPFIAMGLALRGY